jgi:hypothetical protein
MSSKESTMQKSIRRSALTAAAVAALIGLGTACGPPPATTIPPAWAVEFDLASTIPPQCGCPNYASIVLTKAENFGHPAGTVLRVDQVDRAFIGNHGGYDLLVEYA